MQGEVEAEAEETATVLATLEDRERRLGLAQLAWRGNQENQETIDLTLHSYEGELGRVHLLVMRNLHKFVRADYNFLPVQ